MASLLMNSPLVTRRRAQLLFFCLLTTAMTLLPPNTTASTTESSPVSVDRAVDDSHLRALERSLASQPDRVKTRYPARNPAETLSFF